MSRLELILFDTPEALAHAAADRWLRELPSSGARTVALSGGRIARVFFSTVARVAGGGAERLASLEFFWADERCVPPDHPDSNYALGRTHLLEPLGVPADRIHRVRGELEPAVAAAAASAELERLAPTGAAGVPIFDWVFLGMGEDGHVASLFPGPEGTPPREATAYRAVTAPKPPPRRITLTYPVLGCARVVWVLVSGPGKEDALAESLSDGGTTPLARLIRSRDSTLIFSDVRPGGGVRKKH